MLTCDADADDPHDTSPKSHPLAIYTIAITNTHRPHEADRPPRLMSHPIRYWELVAHMSDYPPVLVTAFCDHKHGKAKENIFRTTLHVHLDYWTTSPPNGRIT
jgi:hypothetical protein